MPLRYSILESAKLVYVVGDGTITHQELIEHLDELSRDERYFPPMKKLVDYRRALSMNPTKQEMQSFLDRVGHLQDRFKGEQCALVVNSELSFGISRMYCARQEFFLPGMATATFIRFDDALRWLDINPGTSEDQWFSAVEW